MRAEEDGQMTEPASDTQSTTQPDAGSALQRWSRRKLAARAEPQPEAANASPTGTPTPDPAALASSNDHTPSAPPEADERPGLPDHPSLPDIDTLDEDSDYSAFLSPEVEASVRRVALRKLFGLPCFAVRDGLDDYDDDFGSFKGLGDIVTHEMKRLAAQELARQQQDDGELDAQLADHPQPSGHPQQLADSETQAERPNDNNQIDNNQPAGSDAIASQTSPNNNPQPEATLQEPSSHV